MTTETKGKASEQSDPVSSHRGSPWEWLGLVVLAALLYLPNLGAYDLWSPDEPRFGQVAREMLASGDWIVPRVNGEIYTDKPPLLFWLVALLALLRGGEVTALVARLPSAAAAIGGVLVTYDLGRRLFNRRVGVLGATILSVTFVYAYQARNAQLDMLLSFFCYVAVWAAWLCYRSERRRPAVAMLFWAAMALATLSKGPPGLIVPLGTVLLFLAARGEMRMFARLSPVRGPVLFAAIVCAWLVPMSLSIPKRATQDLLVWQTVIRYFASTHHEEPWYFFIEVLSYDFLPWVVFLPSALYVLLPARKGTTARADGRPRRAIARLLAASAVALAVAYGALTLLYWADWWSAQGYVVIRVLRTAIVWIVALPWAFYAIVRVIRRYGDPAPQLLLSWFLFTVFFFSLSSGKRDQYILPMYPSLALLVAVFWEPYFFGRRAMERKLWIPAAALVVILLAAVIGSTRILEEITEADKVGEALLVESRAMQVIAALLAAALAGSIWAGRARLVFSLTVVTAAAATLYMVFLVFPPINWIKSGRRICYAIEAERRPGDRVFTYDIFREEYLLFGDYFVERVGKAGPVIEAMRGPQRVFCILRASDVGDLRRLLGDDPLYVIWRGYVGHRVMAVVSNRPSRLPHLREAMAAQKTIADVGGNSRRVTAD